MATTTPNYEINYDDERFTQVESGRQDALKENENLYTGMVDKSDQFYQAQIDASKEWASTQQQLQQEKTDFAIEQVEQNKANAKKDYLKEQSGAYVDWQKQSNQYGVNAEQMASQGMTNTGFSESSQVSMYNTYQNRVATARESYSRAIQNYDNSITEARLQNNSILAEIAYESLQQQLELSLQGFQYKNNLLQQMAEQKNVINNRFDTKYQQVLDQMNRDNALAEDVRQYNQNYEFDVKKHNESVRQYNETLAEQIRQYNTSLAEEKRQHDENLAEDKRQFNATIAEDQRQFNVTQANNSSSGSKINKPSGSSNSNGSGTVGKTNEMVALNDGSAKTTSNSDVSKSSSTLLLPDAWRAWVKKYPASAEAKYSTYKDYANDYLNWSKSEAEKNPVTLPTNGSVAKNSSVANTLKNLKVQLFQ